MSKHPELLGTYFVEKLKRGKGFYCSYHREKIEPILIGQIGVSPQLACKRCLDEEFPHMQDAYYLKDDATCASEGCTNVACGKCGLCGKKCCMVCLLDDVGTPCLECAARGAIDFSDDDDEAIFSSDISVLRGIEGQIVLGEF